MSTPPEIIDALESILEIYFSGVRHRERAAFILCDNLVEMTCKTKAKQHNHRFDMICNFHDACTAPGVSNFTRISTISFHDFYCAFTNSRYPLLSSFTAKS